MALAEVINPASLRVIKKSQKRSSRKCATVPMDLLEAIKKIFVTARSEIEDVDEVSFVTPQNQISITNSAESSQDEEDDYSNTSDTSSITDDYDDSNCQPKELQFDDQYTNWDDYGDGDGYDDTYGGDVDERLMDIADEYEQKLLLRSRYKHTSTTLRSKKYNKKPKVNPKRYVKVWESKKEEKIQQNRMDNIEAKKSNKPKVEPHIYSPPLERRSTLPPASSTTSRYRSIEEIELERALQESRNAVAPSGLTYQQIMDLSTRELTPEDYLLLLQLDETVQKKTLSKSEVSAFQVRIYDGDSSELCAICFANYTHGEKVTTLPCNHYFHEACITQWLTTSNVTCPMCGMRLKD